MLDPESKIQKVHFLVISYNYDCPKTNQMSLNLFNPNKILKLVPGFWPGKLDFLVVQFSDDVRSAYSNKSSEKSQ